VTDWEVPRSLRQRVGGTASVVRLGLRLVWRTSPGLTMAMLAALVVEAALVPAQLALTGLVIDRIVDGGAVVPTAMAVAVALAASQVIAPILATAQSLAGDRLTAHVGAELITAANGWPGLSRFEDPAFRDDVHVARSRAGTGSLEVVLLGARFGLAVFSAVGLAIALVGLHPLAPVLVIAAALPLMAGEYVFINRTGSHLYSQTAESRRLAYCRDVQLEPQPANDIRLFGLGPFFAERYDEAYEKTTGDLQRLRRRLTPRMCLAGMLAAASTAAVYVYTVAEVAGGRASVGDLVLYGGAALALQARMSGIGFDIGFLPSALVFLPSLFRVLEAAPDLAVPANPVAVPAPLRLGVSFENVRFTYPGRDEPALDAVSFHLPAGGCLALVGHNGAGKTTVVKLLMRLYDPDGGRITLDGVELTAFDPTDLRRRFSAIFQDFVHYELSAGENIGLGAVEALDDPAVIAQAAQKAGADMVVASLDEGPATQVGRQFGGRELSEGEWQKLALARALARDSDLLVLDEPTSSLDPRAEYDLYCRFRDLTRGRTTLLVSHRLSTARLADQIVFLSQGRVVEAGTHEALVAADGGYARFYRRQAAQHLGGERA